MPLFRKKKRELPAEEFTLPEPPELPRHPPNIHPPLHEDLPELPEFPGLEAKDDGEAIKREFDIPTERGDRLTPGRIEMGEELPPLIPRSIPSMPPAIMPKRKRFISPVERPIFVKIDKFKESIEHLNEIREKLGKASALLQRLREIRQQEDHELSTWERDLNDLKESLESIDRKLFSDIE